MEQLMAVQMGRLMAVWREQAKGASWVSRTELEREERMVRHLVLMTRRERRTDRPIPMDWKLVGSKEHM
jgi:hypothetical protein